MRGGFVAASIAIVAGLAGAGSLTGPTWIAEGNQVFALFGDWVAGAGDVNGDGYDDLIIGEPWYDNGQTDEGRVWLFLGSAAGVSTTPAWVVEGEHAGGELGSPVAGAGDVNGDGYDDVVVGAKGYDNGQTDEGRVFVFHGGSGGLPLVPSWIAEGDQVGANFGIAAAGVGDVNGDGFADLAVGADVFDNGQTDEGRVFVYHGSPAGLAAAPARTLEADQAGAQFGFGLDGAGDVNGDGYSDVIVGALFHDNGQTDEGRAYVYLGSPAGVASVAAWRTESNVADARFGSWVGSARDIDGDGFSDVLVGSWFHDGPENAEGRADFYRGSAAGLSTVAAWSAEANQALAHFGFPLMGVGDVDGDGFGDVVVGAHGYDNGELQEGRVSLYRGSAAGLPAVASWTGESNQQECYFGQALGAAGDVNGDGFADVVVGAPTYDNGQFNEGRAFAFLGAGTAGPPPSGRVPAGPGGPPLRLRKAVAGALTLSWGPSCSGTDTDYAVYEGTLGSFASHAPRTCTTSGLRARTLAAPSGSAYFLIVPRHAASEGSYGTSSAGERAPAAAACRTQRLAACE